MDEVKREIVGISCVGGKTKLAKFLCETIEKICTENGISTYISACGGGGKDIGIERVMLTELAAKAFNEAEIHISLFRHSNLDWGSLPEQDKKANDAALKDGGRVFSFYVDVAVVTEFNDCNVTTICLISEIE